MIRRHIAYGKYVIRHKWFVMLSCFGEGLFWRGLVHDLSKFRPSEWFPYARYFYNKDGTSRMAKTEDGFYKHTDAEDHGLDFAWLLHQKRNRHHWQFWLLPADDGGTNILCMGKNDRVEMVCDWVGAGRAQGVDNWASPSPWYEINKGKIQLHAKTREAVMWALWTLKAQHERTGNGDVVHRTTK